MFAKPQKFTNSNDAQLNNFVDIIERHSECSICMASLYNASSCAPCLHTFCAGCIVRWIENNNGKCPMCRASVIDLSPNWVMRDLIDSFLQVKPELQRSQEDKDTLDKAELAYTVKWLGSTDERMLYVESLSSLRSAPESGDLKYAAMKTRAGELFKKLLNRDGTEIPRETMKRVMDKLIEDVNKNLFPAKVFLKYHRLERAYMYMVRISIPKLGPSEHSCIGNYCFDTSYLDDLEVYSDEYDDDDFEVHMPERIDEALHEMRHPEVQKPTRASIDGFDPVDLQALARVQNMSAPGFVRNTPRVDESVWARDLESPEMDHRTRRRAVAQRRITTQRPRNVASLTRSMNRDMNISSSTISNTPPAPQHPRRSARLAARNGEQSQ